MLSVKFKQKYHHQGLKDAPRILHKHMRGGLTAVGKRLVTASRRYMREDTGAAKQSLRYRVSGTQLNLDVIVFSNLVQAFVDAYGLKARQAFPPYMVGSQLYQWAARHPIPEGRSGTKTSKGVRRSRRMQVRKSKRAAKGHVASKKRLTGKQNSIQRRSYAIAKSIYNHGIKGTEWNRRALEASRQTIIREMSNAISRAANELRRRGTA